MQDPKTQTRLTKRTLVTVSHAIEQAALAVAEDGPMVVIALFQRLPYFERERAAYERIAKASAATVVGVVAEQAPDLPAGPSAVLLDEQESLAREWTVAVLTPRFGAVLVARDREEIDPAAPTIESGRLFDGWWRFRRDDALHEVLRLRATLSDRLPEDARAAIDDVIGRVRDVPAAPGESRTDAAVRLFADRTDRDRALIHSLRQQVGAAGAGHPETPALASDTDVRRWSGADGITSSGVLPVALIGIRVAAAQSLPEHAGRRSAALRNEGLITVLTGPMRPGDRATRLAEDEFLLIMPSLSYDAAVELAYRVGTDLDAASRRNAFLSAAANVVVAVTRRRPLPVEEIRDALRWAVAEGVPVAALNRE